MRTYEDQLAEFLRLKSCRRYVEAIAELDVAINLAPHWSCIPTLMRMRNETKSLAPKRWNWRKLAMDVVG